MTQFSTRRNGCVLLKRPLPVARCQLRVDIKPPVGNINMPVDDKKTPVDIKVPVGTFAS